MLTGIRLIIYDLYWVLAASEPDYLIDELKGLREIVFV